MSTRRALDEFRNQQSPVPKANMTIEEPVAVDDTEDGSQDSEYGSDTSSSSKFKRPKSPVHVRRKIRQSASPNKSRKTECSSTSVTRKVVEIKITTETAKSHTFWIAGVLLVVLSIVIGFTYISHDVSKLEASGSQEMWLSIFKNKFRDFRERFPKQNGDTWKVISAAVKTVLDKGEPAQPAVIAVFGKQSNSETVSCFAKLLSKTIESVFESRSSYTHFNGLGFKQINAGDVKHKLEDTARDGFENGSHTYLFENVDHLPGDSALIFHALCDNENAPYKRAVYIMTIAAVYEEPVALKELEVSKAWQHLEENVRSALESRIGVNKIWLGSEDGAYFNKNCQGL